VSQIWGFLLWGLHKSGSLEAELPRILSLVFLSFLAYLEEVCGALGGLCDEPLWPGPSADSLNRVLGLGSRCCPSRNCSALCRWACPEDSVRMVSQENFDP